MARQLMKKFDNNNSGGLDANQAREFIKETVETTFEIAISRFSEEVIEANGGMDVSKQ